MLSYCGELPIKRALQSVALQPSEETISSPFEDDLRLGTLDC